MLSPEGAKQINDFFTAQEEEKLQTEQKPYRAFLNGQVLTPEEWRWTQIPAGKRDVQYYDSPLREDILRKLKSLQTLDTAITDFEQRESVSITGYEAWSGAQKQSFHALIADLVFRAGSNEAEMKQRDNFQIDALTMRKYLRTFQLGTGEKGRKAAEKIEEESVMQIVDEGNQKMDYLAFLAGLKRAGVFEDFIRWEGTLAKATPFARDTFRPKAVGANGSMLFEVRDERGGIGYLTVNAKHCPYNAARGYRNNAFMYNQANVKDILGFAGEFTVHRH